MDLITNKATMVVTGKLFGRIRQYLGTPVIQHLSINEQLRCCLFMITIVAITTLLVDILSGVPGSLWGHTISALIKGFCYMLGICFAEVAISFFSRKDLRLRGISVGKTWFVSFVGFCLGYLLLEPYRAQYGHLHHHGASNDLVLFVKISPIWFLLTLLFIQYHLKRSLNERVEQLDSVNKSLKTTLASGANDLKENSKADVGERGVRRAQTIALPDKSGRTITLSVLSHVEVVEHYCYLHVHAQDDLSRIEVKSSLKQMHELLPKDLFVHVHRSFLVNLSHISHIEKIPRSYALYLKYSDEPINVSRYRISEILPQIEQFLENREADSS